MSRGTEAMDTVLPTGSSEATIIVSVAAVLRPTPESIPISSTLMRGTSGVGVGVGDADGCSDGDAATPKSGSLEATGGAVAAGIQAPPPTTGA